MENSDLDTAVKLLQKAQSTEFDAEAVALAERAYRLLAAVITAYDAAQEAGGAPVRRRERRWLGDRRRDRRREGAPAGTGSTAAGSAVHRSISTYRRVSGPADQGGEPNISVSL